MDRGLKLQRISNHLLSAARATTLAALTVFGSFGAASLAHAASFKCPRNASASERLTCADPELSAMDDRLALAYRKAYDASLDTTALEAERVKKWQWRQHNCKDNACVAAWYTRRLAELDANLAQSRQEAALQVRRNMADQRIAPPAQSAVLQLKGFAPAADDTKNAAPEASSNGAAPQADAKPALSASQKS